MKTPTLFTAVATLAMSLTLSASEENAESVEATMTGPYVHENLAVYLIHGKDTIDGLPILTLEEALEKKLVEVKETGDVSELKIRNKSKDHYIYVLPGDIIKGGKQDRTLPNGFLMTMNSGFIPVDSFCVEQGRWSKRGGESADHFAGSTKALAGKELKLAARYSKSQGEVWDKVAVAQEKLSRNVGKDVKAASSVSSLQLTLENKDLEKMVSDCTRKISEAAEPDQEDAIGMAFAINGEFNSADSFASRELFRKLWPKLLESAATEALGERVADQEYEVPNAHAVEALVADTASAEEEREDLAGDNYILRSETEKSVSFDAYGPVEKQALRVHRNVLSRPEDLKPAVSADTSQRPRRQVGSQTPAPAAQNGETPAQEKKGFLKSIGSLFRRR